MRVHILGEVLTAHFPLFEPDGVTKKSGVVGFTTTTWRDGALDPQPVSVTEIAATGEYTAAYTPPTVGPWELEVYDPTTEVRWREDVIVEQARSQWGFSASDDTADISFSVWMQIDEQTVLDLDDMAAEVRSQDGSVVVAMGTETVPDAFGVYRFTASAALVPAGNEYYLSLSASRGIVAWTGTLGFNKV
jgi:hypothetical protein